jgi:hypothetical protein
MAARQTQYRGYKIKILRSDSGWRIEATSPSPKVPCLQLFSFSVNVTSEEDAINLVEEEIDRVLDSWAKSETEKN